MKKLTRRDFISHVSTGVLGVMMSGAFASRRDRENRKPDIVFIMTDHQRADSLGMVQSGVEVCPNLNGLASESIVFSRAYTTCPLCVPARTALATGKYPTRNGIVFNDWKGVRAGDHVPIHQYLDLAGYEVAHIGVDHIRVKPGLRERLRFAEWIGNADYAKYLEENEINADPPEEIFKREVIENQNGERVPVKYSNTRTAVWKPEARHFKDNYFCDKAIEFIRRDHQKPFALFLYLWAPHPPLRVPEPYASMFDPRRIELPENVGQPAEDEPKNRRQGIAAQLAEGVSIDQWRKVWAAHLGLVRLADEGIGRVLDALSIYGDPDNTITVFTSDHGDHLGQHRMYQKMEMYEQAIRVPLILRVPGERPRLFDNPVSHLDIMPTLMEITDLDIPDDLDGIHLLDSDESRIVHSQYSGNPTIGDIRRAAIGKRYKYIYDPNDLPELYDLENDPLEMRNLAGDPDLADVQRKLHEECRSWCESHGDWIEFKS